MKKLFIIILCLSCLNLTVFVSAQYSQELQEAYKWAYDNGVTTMDSIEKANMNGKISREEMSKMISNYAKNILGIVPDTTKPCLFLNSNINPDLVQSVTESCQLGLMGQGISDFRPKDSVTRAEFGTVLSRALWGDKNEGGSNYYENHLKALKAEGIMNKIYTPMDKEVRGYVMLMLMRSANNNTNNKPKSNIDDQISDVIKMLD